MTTKGPIAGSAGGEHAERFTHLRPLLFTIVYEILGSATESDDVLSRSTSSPQTLRIGAVSTSPDTDEHSSA